MIRILIVARYASVRAGLRTLLSGPGEIVVIGEAAGAEELDSLRLTAPVDALLLDYSDYDGPAVIEWAGRQAIAIVALGEDRAGFRRLAESGSPGWAYLLKDSEGEEIAGALHAASSGLISLDRGLWKEFTGRQTSAAVSGGQAHDEPLTGRELEVLQLMAGGLPNKTVAAKLGISPHTVKFHVASILSKLHVSSRTEAVSVGVRRGLIAL